MISIVPLLVMLVGLFLYYRTSPPADPRTSAVALHMFWVGLLVFLLQLPAFVVAVASFHWF